MYYAAVARRGINDGVFGVVDAGAGQQKFVGDPLRMMLIGLEEESRHPFAVDENGAAVGVLTLQAGAATLAGWPEDNTAWLLRGFLIDSADADPIRADDFHTLLVAAQVRLSANGDVAVTMEQEG